MRKLPRKGTTIVQLGDAAARTNSSVLLDDQFAPLTEKIVAAIKSVGGDFPIFLSNSHYHGDHTGGNENMGQGGTLIFSHNNVRERLSTHSFIKLFNKKREAVFREGLPVVTFSEDTGTLSAAK